MKTSLDSRTAGSTGLVFAYAAMTAAAIFAYLAIRRYGDTLHAPVLAGPVRASSAVAASADQVIAHLLLALIVVIVMARGLGALFKAFHQPAVVGEIIAGIMLGPSVLGRIAPGASACVLPSSVAPYLNVISQVGIILYMFLVGLELDPGLLRNRGRATVAISHASILAPFLLGTGLSLVLYPRLSSGAVEFTNFSLFVGVAMSVTAFPVLARILTDRGIHRTRMGAIALTCAAVDDVTAWCLLALVVSIVEADTTGALRTIGMALAFIAAMVVAVRPAMVRLTLLYGNRGLSQGIMAAVFVALLACALTTDLIGIHAIFGAFALGAMIPHDSSLARELTDRLEDLVVVLLLPAFFAFTGMRTQIGLVSGAEQWMLFACVIAVASIGKFGGATIAARISGLGWRDSSALGVLMNTRGLMELIVLNIGYELHVISPVLFAMLVLMALVTTFMTTPILHLVAPEAERSGKEAADAPAAPESTVKLRLLRPMRQGILVPISNPDKVRPLVELALAATGAGDAPPRVAAFVRRPVGGVRSGLREVEQRVVPRSVALSSALDYALEHGGAIVPQASWTDDPARDIVALARRTRARWIMLGFHRPVFGADFRGGAVREIVRGAESMALNVAIVVNAHEPHGGGISAVVDDSPHGWASLELGARIAAGRRCDLHLLYVSGSDDGESGGAHLKEMLKTAATRVSRVDAKTIRAGTADEFESQLNSQLIIVGTNLVDEIGLAPHLKYEKRCIVVVQGSLMREDDEEMAGEAGLAN